jgi:hypothetical protein
MMGSDDCHQVTRSADVALEVLVRAYHVLAVLYELANPGAYAALHDKMMPYLLDSFGAGPTQKTFDLDATEVLSTALERVRNTLDDVQSDVAAVRGRRTEG